MPWSPPAPPSPPQPPVPADVVEAVQNAAEDTAAVVEEVVRWAEEAGADAEAGARDIDSAGRRGDAAIMRLASEADAAIRAAAEAARRSAEHGHGMLPSLLAVLTIAQAVLTAAIAVAILTAQRDAASGMQQIHRLQRSLRRLEDKVGAALRAVDGLRNRQVAEARRDAAALSVIVLGFLARQIGLTDVVSRIEEILRRMRRSGADAVGGAAGSCAPGARGDVTLHRLESAVARLGRSLVRRRPPPPVVLGSAVALDRVRVAVSASGGLVTLAAARAAKADAPGNAKIGQPLPSQFRRGAPLARPPVSRPVR